MFVKFVVRYVACYSLMYVVVRCLLLLVSCFVVVAG